MENIDFKLLFESVPGLFLILSPDLKILTASDAYLKATITKREDVIGHGLFEIFPDNPDDPAADGVSNLRSSLNFVLKNKDTHTMAVQKYDIRKTDGTFEVRYWSPMNKPVLDSHNEILYIIHRAEDVTDFVMMKAIQNEKEQESSEAIRRMEMEIFSKAQTIQKFNKELESVNSELESFSYSVSHDLRSPLRAINGYAKMIEEDFADKLDSEGKRMLNVIKDNARNMGLLIDDLLDFSKLGRKELIKKNVNMNELVKDILTEVSKTIPDKTKVKISELHNIQADVALIKQVMINLISNAVKYSSKKENPLVEIWSEDEGNFISYCVKDNGAGFDMKFVNKIFGVFERLHSPMEFEGTGVGLALVKRIIIKHGGKIHAEGKVNEGALFCFAIPKN